MRKLCGEMFRRTLGIGYCARPVEMDCHFESICESCTSFVAPIVFRPTLRKQREDADAKGQVARTNIFDGLLDHLASPRSARRLHGAPMGCWMLHLDASSGQL